MTGGMLDICLEFWPRTLQLVRDQRKNFVIKNTLFIRQIKLYPFYLECKCAGLLSSGDVFQNTIFKYNLFKTISEFQTVWIQIITDVLSVL